MHAVCTVLVGPADEVVHCEFQNGLSQQRLSFDPTLSYYWLG